MISFLRGKGPIILILRVELLICKLIFSGYT
uniref:Uncharacterized protein n=1 Tax=Rhizophora mucronata TaxID=61149 RepID=A0A2P2QC59_RHIMU